MSENTKQVAIAVVMNQDGMILLHKRADLRIWSLPGGGVEESETPNQTAVRETHEETGFQIEIDQYIGEYHRPQMGEIRHVFRGHLSGGEAILRGPETLQVAWFPSTKLPTRTTKSVRTIVADAINADVLPLQKLELFPIWKLFSIKALLWLRNQRNRWQGRK